MCRAFQFVDIIRLKRPVHIARALCSLLAKDATMSCLIFHVADLQTIRTYQSCFLAYNRNFLPVLTVLTGCGEEGANGYDIKNAAYIFHSNANPVMYVYYIYYPIMYIYVYILPQPDIETVLPLAPPHTRTKCHPHPHEIPSSLLSHACRNCRESRWRGWYRTP